MRLAVEVRHPDFYNEQGAEALNDLLRQHNTARVLMDTRPIRTGTAQEQRILQAHERKPNLPLQIVATTDFAFVRYIGHPKSEVNSPFLDEWVQQCKQWLTQGLTLYMFCHCPFEVYSPSICLELYTRLTKVFSLPVLPWLEEQSDKEIEQGHLF